MPQYTKEEWELLEESRKRHEADKKLIQTKEISGLDDLLFDPRLLKKSSGLPAAYELKTKKSFAVTIPGVDSFLVHCVNEVPEFKRSWFFLDMLKCVGDLKITFHSPVSPSILQQLSQLIKLNRKFKIVLKQLDAVGKVVAQQTFAECNLKAFRVLNYSYDSNDTEKVLGTFKCKYVSIDF